MQKFAELIKFIDSTLISYNSLKRNRVVGQPKVANWIMDPLLPNFFILFLSPSILFSGLSCLDVCGQFCVES